MNLNKFVSLLETSALFFARVDKLGDPAEGSLPRANGPSRPTRLLLGDRTLVSPSILPIWRQDLARFTLVNCWHKNPHESSVMWRLYSGERTGIAVKTNFSSLQRSFACEQKIWIGEVNYFDYTTTQLDESNPYAPLVSKRKDFEFEQEVRALADVSPETEDGPVRVPEDVCDVGEFFQVALSLLLHEIVVGPLANGSFLSLVGSLVSRYGLDVEVRRSELSYIPTFGNPADFPDTFSDVTDPGEFYVDPLTRHLMVRDGRL